MELPQFLAPAYQRPIIRSDQINADVKNSFGFGKKE
jgi:hypothetical protein